MRKDTNRREFLKTAGCALTSSIFAGNLKGANDRVAVAFIGTGRMGMKNLECAMKQTNVQVVAVCDVYRPRLEEAVAFVEENGQRARPVKDFREIITDGSIDVVCISTPDHWHAYMTVEACKAGKDVYIEKPLCTFLVEGKRMVEAARKYERVVQAGTMQRSGAHFQKACEIVRSGQLGKITFCRTFNYHDEQAEGMGNPPDCDPPPGLDWDLWLGPAPKRPFNPNRFGKDPTGWSAFRRFWDYAGGYTTDVGVHVLDIVHMAFGEPMPTSVVALGGRLWVTDNTETPDTFEVTLDYPGFIVGYEYRLANSQPLFQSGYGTSFHGSKGTLFVNRSLYRVLPEADSGLAAAEEKVSNESYTAHWANFLECVRTRQKPASDIETCYRSTAACLLANISLRSKRRVDWDDRNQTVVQHEARKYLSREYRHPWKLAV